MKRREKAMENNYILYIAVGLVFVCGAIFIYFAYKYPSKVREWLLYAVTIAEKEYGGGTGQIKLRAVYDKFLAKYPKLSFFISFETFSGWVDIVLDKMRVMIEENPAANALVKG
jgi:hypothetical protein